MSKTKVYLNGKIMSQDQAKISVFDRGLFYGDGVFESFRTYQGKPFLLEDHIKRLLRSAKSIRLRGIPSASQLKQAVIKTIAANKFKESYVKIIITRGNAKSHGLDIKNVIGKATVIILVEQQNPYPANTFSAGWKVIVSDLKRPSLPSSRIKSLNYLNNIIALSDARKAGANEALLLSDNGYLVEGTFSNIFIVKHGILYTPPKSAPILLGISRNLVIKLAQQSAFRIVEKDLTPKELYTADECFITFSGAGIVPITKIWNKKIGSGKCGYTTESLIKLYADETRSRK